MTTQPKKLILSLLISASFSVCGANANDDDASMNTQASTVPKNLSAQANEYIEIILALADVPENLRTQTVNKVITLMSGMYGPHIAEMIPIISNMPEN